MAPAHHAPSLVAACHARCCTHPASPRFPLLASRSQPGLLHSPPCRVLAWRRDMSDGGGGDKASSIACCGHDPKTRVVRLAFQPEGGMLVSVKGSKGPGGLLTQSEPGRGASCSARGSLSPRGPGGKRALLGRTHTATTLASLRTAAGLLEHGLRSSITCQAGPAASLHQATASDGGRIVLYNVKQFWKGGVVGPAAGVQLEPTGGRAGRGLASAAQRVVAWGCQRWLAMCAGGSGAQWQRSGRGVARVRAWAAGLDLLRPLWLRVQATR